MIKKTSNALLGTFTTSILILLLNVITGIILARFLRPDGRGALAAALFWPHLIAGIGILSLNEAITYRTCQADSDVNKTVPSGFWLALLLAFVSSLIGYMLLPYLLGKERSELILLSQIYILFFLPFHFIDLTMLSYDLGQLSFKRYNILRFMQPLIYLGGLVFIWLSNDVNVNNVAYVVLLSTFLSAVTRMLLENRNLLKKPAWNEMNKLIKTGWSFHTTNLVIFANSEIDRLIIIALLDNNKVGIYVVALTIASAGLGIISQTFKTVIFPYISKTERINEQRALIAESLRHVMFLLTLYTGLLIVISPWIIPFLFGKEFQQSIVPSIVLLIAFVPKALRNIIIYNLRGLGKVQPGTIAELLNLLVFVMLALPFINHFDLVGAGLALLISNILSLTYLSAYLHRNLSLSPLQWWGLNLTTMKKIINAGQYILGNR
jgi:O-antigen/teichoic acid export membrane protein